MIRSPTAVAKVVGFSATALVVASLVALAMRAYGATPYFVATTGSDGNDCLTLPTACRTIGSALAKAAPNDLIIVADGTYTEHLTLDKNITLTGFSQGTTTISGGGAGRVVTVSAGVTVDLSNIRVADGLADYVAGIYISGTLRLSRATIAAHVNNGIYNDGTLVGSALTIEGNHYAGVVNFGTAILSDSVVANNQIGIINRGSFRLAGSAVLSNAPGGLPGGGIANYGNMAIEGGILRGNTVLADNGGGIYNHGHLWINRTAILSNTASSPPPLDIQHSEAGPLSLGGGIYNAYGGTLTMTNSALAGNSASTSDDQFSNFGIARFTNMTLSGDDGHRGMGSGQITLTNVTISNMPSGIIASPMAVAVNTIISGTYCTATMTSLGHNLESGNTCGFGATGDLTNTNPLLGPLQDNGGPTPTHALLPGSPAINAGDNAACPATDQRGVPRPQLGACDIGAFEFAYPLYLPAIYR